MRVSWSSFVGLATFVAACSGNRASTSSEPTAGSGSATPTDPDVITTAAPPDGAKPRFRSFPGDKDGDSVLDKCDQCPDSLELFNGLDDLDGCVDSIDDQVADHPSNRYAQPLVKFAFEGVTTTPSTPFVQWEIPDDVEAIACIGASRDDREVARTRAKLLCDHLRGYLPKQRPKLAIVEVAVNARPTYRRDNGAWFGATGELRVLRAAGVELWRPDGDQLVEITPRRTKNPRPVTPECRALPPRENFYRPTDD